MQKSPTSAILLSSLALALAACGAEDSSLDQSGQEALTGTPAVCAAQHSGKNGDGVSLLVCDQVFATAPHVRPPADAHPAKGASTLYLGADDHGLFTDRSGVQYQAVDAKGKALANTALPAAMKMPSNRNLLYVYQVTGAVGTYTDPSGNKYPSINISTIAPYILISESAFDTAFTAWEGTVSKRKSASAFDPSKLAPIRISISSYTAARAIPVWDVVTKGLPDGAVDNLVGAIANFSSAVKGSDGKCIPALSSLGTANPFSGARSGAISMFRMATMHFPGDQVMVFEYPAGTTGLATSGMGGITILSPAGLLQDSAKDPFWGDQQINPHAAPNGHVMHLHPVSGGGGGC